MYIYIYIISIPKTFLRNAVAKSTHISPTIKATTKIVALKVTPKQIALTTSNTISPTADLTSVFVYIKMYVYLHKLNQNCNRKYIHIN